MKILNKKGLTIAEAVIAMMLLAIVTMGIYGVIMASVRSGQKPDMREGMAYAIEQASALLKNKTLGANMLCTQWNDDGTCGSYLPPCPVNYYHASDGSCGVPIRPPLPCLDLDDQGCISFYRDICGNLLPNYISVFDSMTHGMPVTNVDNPFTAGVYYKIDCVPLPEACDKDTSSFFYTVKYTTDGFRNIQFRIVCNGAVI